MANDCNLIAILYRLPLVLRCNISNWCVVNAKLSPVRYCTNCLITLSIAALLLLDFDNFSIYFLFNLTKDCLARLRPTVAVCNLRRKSSFLCVFDDKYSPVCEAVDLNFPDVVAMLVVWPRSPVVLDTDLIDEDNGEHCQMPLVGEPSRNKINQQLAFLMSNAVFTYFIV